MVTYIVIALGCSFLFLASLAFDVDHDISDALSFDHHGHGDSIFSIRSLLLFGVGFGATGAIGLSYDLGQTASVAVAGSLGLVFAFIGLKLTRALQSQEGTSTRTDADILHCYGRVVHNIPLMSFGQVLITDRGGRNVYMRARAQEPIKDHTIIKVTGVFGDTVEVIPVSTAA